MKRLISLILCVFFICITGFCFTSCSETQPKPPVTDFSGEICVNTNDTQINGSFSNNRQGVMTFIVTSPDNISGLKYEYKDEVLTVSFEGITTETVLGNLPSDNFINLLNDCMFNLNNEENTNLSSFDEQSAVYNVKSSENTYSVYTQTDTGIITKIENDAMTAEFFNQKKFKEN